MSGQKSAPSGPAIITRDDGASIAYHRLAGQSPTVVFLTGFKSDMMGKKALCLESLCRKLGYGFIRFDYFGHGESSGDFDDGTIGRWADDAVFIIDQLTEGPLVLVGSSMGGWLMLLTALQRPERIAGLIGIAAAPDFTEDLIEAELTAEQKADLKRDGVVEIPNCYDPDSPYRISQAFIDEGRAHLLLRDTIAIDCPVRLIHGLKDKDVPFDTSLRLADKLRTPNVEVTLVKDGNHRLSEPHDIERLCHTTKNLLLEIEKQ
jgi:pimeloyl-ACP methyl ester carboxylesterase